MGPERKEPDDTSLETMIRVAFQRPDRSRSSAPDRRWVEVNEALNPIWKEAAPTAGRRVRYAQLAVAIVCAATSFATIRLESGDMSNLASIVAYEPDISGRYRDGGGGPQSDLAVGASLLVAASKRSWAGSHPDDQLIDVASRYLEAAYFGTTDPFQRAEASFFRAKAAFMVGETNVATRWLRTCLEQRVEDYNEDARELLEAIRR